MAALIEKVRLGVITGLTREVACLKAGGWLRRSVGRPMTFAAAGQPAVAAEAARRMVAEGASGLVSFGIAGGLDPSLGSGVVVVADRVVLPGGGSVACHDPWVTRLLQAEGTLDSGAVLGSDDAIMTAARKAALYREHEALAVDMESHAVATVAKETGVPFVAIRAIGDPATRSIPRAALAGLSPSSWPSSAARRTCPRS